MLRSAPMITEVMKRLAGFIGKGQTGHPRECPSRAFRLPHP
jgi:hypothetical protein